MDNSISVGSLNFSGINLSYFEYDDGSKLFESLNRKYELIKEKEFPNLKSWLGSYLDKKYKEHRFTVLSGDLFVKKLGQKLLSKQKFEEEWLSTYEEAKALKKLIQNYQAREEEVKDVLKMDFSFYRALVMHLYEFNSVEEYEQRYSSKSTKILKDTLKQFRDQPRFQLNYKQRLVEDYYHTMDVMFLQEANVVKWKVTPEYQIAEKKGSIIIFKTKVFGKIDEKLTKIWQPLLDFNQDTVAVITKNKKFQQSQGRAPVKQQQEQQYLLISSHLASSQKQNRGQADEIFRAINSYRQYFSHLPQPLKIIIGVDANHFIQPQLIEQKLTKKGMEFHMFPNNDKQFTTNKKRSYLQAQIKKAGVQVTEVKDHIITTLSIREKYISLIDGSKSQNQLLPNDQHPYDHYVIAGFLKKK